MIKTNSWHYKLANLGGRSIYPGQNINFCDYTRNVISGFLLFTFMVLFVVGGSLGVVTCFYQFFRWVFTGVAMHEVCASGLYAMFVITLVLLGFNFQETISKKLKSNKEKENPGFFKLLYLKWKQKTCFILEVEDE